MTLFDKSRRFSDRFFLKPNEKNIFATSALFSEDILKKYQLSEFTPKSVILIYLILRYFNPTNRRNDVFAVKRIHNLNFYKCPFIKNIRLKIFQRGVGQYSSMHRPISVHDLNKMQKLENVILNGDLILRSIISEDKNQKSFELQFKRMNKRFGGAFQQSFEVLPNITSLVPTGFLFQSFRRLNGPDSYLSAYIHIRKGKQYGGGPKPGISIEHSPGVNAVLNGFNQNVKSYYKKYFSRNIELKSEKFTKQNYKWKSIYNHSISHQKKISASLNNQNRQVSIVGQVDDLMKIETTHKPLTSQFFKMLQRHPSIAEKSNNLIFSMGPGRLIQKQVSHPNQNERFNQSENLELKRERPYEPREMVEYLSHAEFNGSSSFEVKAKYNLDGFEGNKRLAYRKKSNFNMKMQYSTRIARIPSNMKALKPISNQSNAKFFMSKDSAFSKKITNEVIRSNSSGSGRASMSVSKNGAYNLQDVVNRRNFYIRHPFRSMGDLHNKENVKTLLEIVHGSIMLEQAKKSSTSIRCLKNIVVNNGVLFSKKDQTLLSHKNNSKIFNETKPIFQYDMIHKNNLILRSPVSRAGFKHENNTDYESEKCTEYPSLTIKSNSKPAGQVVESQQSSNQLLAGREFPEEVSRKIVHEYFQKMPVKTINLVAEKVYDLIENKIYVEQDRRGWI